MYQNFINLKLLNYIRAYKTSLTNFKHPVNLCGDQLMQYYSGSHGNKVNA